MNRVCVSQMISVNKSIRAHYLDFKATHFNLFSEGRRLARLKNIHFGERCFIIGNGPSLNAEDLDLLDSHGEISFGFNRIFHIFSQTSWRPYYYISQDDKMLKSCVNEVSLIPARIKFIPAEFKWYYGIDVKGATYFHLENRINPDIAAFSDRIDKCIYNSNTVVISAIQVAIYMGIKEIYLIGIDHHFHTSIDSQGKIVVDENAKDYFTEEYNKDKSYLYIPNVDKSTSDFIAVKAYADKSGVRIINLTRGGALEVFPRQSFDSFF